MPQFPDGPVRTADESPAQKKVSRAALRPSPRKGDDTLSVLLASLGFLGDSIKDVIDPMYQGRNVVLPNESGEFDPRIIDGRSLLSPRLPDRKEPRRLPLSPRLPKGENP